MVIVATLAPIIGNDYDTHIGADVATVATGSIYTIVAIGVIVAIETIVTIGVIVAIGTIF